MTPALAAQIIISTIILLVSTRMLYLLYEWFFTALYRRYEFWKINRDFKKRLKQYDSPPLARYDAPLKSHPIKGLAETAMSEADYRPFMNDAAEYESTESSKSAA